MPHTRIPLFLGALLLLCTGAPAGAQEIHVASRGRDDNPGTRSHPLRTLEAARDALRARRERPATVWLAPGTYRLNRTFTLDGRDSRTTYRALPGGEVRLTGGGRVTLADLPGVQDPEIRRRLPAPVRDRVKVIDLSVLAPGWTVEKAWPPAFRGYAGWPELFINDRPLHLARWPDQGYATIAKVIDRGSRPRHNEKPDRPGAFRFREEEPATWSTEQEIYLGGYWCFSWYDQVLKVATIDRRSREIRLAAPHRYGIGGPSRGKWYAINVLETLDQPGEYIYDRIRRRLYLLPPPVQGRAACVVSLLDAPLISITGGTAIRLQGLSLTAGRSDGIRITDATGVTLVGCRISHFPGTGVVIRGGRRCGLRRSTLRGMGRGCVTLDGGDRPTLARASHFVSDCHLHDYARLVRTYQPGVGLTGVGHRVTHNYIHDAPHTAILFTGNDHHIAHNRIERVCLDTGDAGAIYCGRDWTLGGNLVERNWFAKLGKGAHHHNWALYPDDQASGITARHNIILDCPAGLLFGGGRRCVIEENLFVRVGRWPIRFDARGTGWGICCEPTLLQRLAAVPTSKEPWCSRFPDLVGLAEKAKRNWPLGNLIRGNIQVDSQESSIDPKVRKGGRVEGNRTLSTKGTWRPRLEQGRVVFPPGGPTLPEAFQGMLIGPRSTR